MEYTPMERMLRLWSLMLKDPDCLACEKEMERAKRRLEKRTNRLSRKEHDEYWEYPTCFGVFHGRFMELVCREMRFPEESAPAEQRNRTPE